MRLPTLTLAVALGGCAPVLRPLTATDAASDLEQVTFANADERDPAISPDGGELAYDVRANRGAPHVEVMAVATRRLVYASRDEAGSEPAWMPDGSSVVFVARTAGERPKLVETQGQGVRPVFLADVGDPSFGGTRPVVSPDGKLVVSTFENVSVRRSGAAARRWDRAIGVTDFVGTGLKVVARGLDPALTPDGKRLAFVREVDGREHVFVARADGSSPVQVTFGADNDQSPAFSPDGKSIVFCAADGVPPVEQANLFEMRADGSGLVQLTEGDRFACHPSWGKDGTIYFDANARGRFHVFRLRPKDAR